MNINGKTYLAVAEKVDGACTGCVAHPSADNSYTLCGKLTPSIGACIEEKRIFIEAPAVDIAVEATKDASFVTSRQAAWDAYADSRVRLTLPGGGNYTRPTQDLPRGQGFNAGYERGYLDGVLAHKARSLDMLPPSVRIEQAVARASDPQTSQDAAARASRQAGKIADLIIQHLDGLEKVRGVPTQGLTGHQLAERTGIPLNSITPRFAQLRRKGLIYAAGGTGRETRWKIGNGIAESRPVHPA